MSRKRNQCGWAVIAKKAKHVFVDTCRDTPEQAISAFDASVSEPMLKFKKRPDLVTIPVSYNPEDIA